MLVAKDMSNEILSGLQSSCRNFRRKINLRNEEDGSSVQIRFKGQSPMMCIIREIPMPIDGIILDGGISALIEFKT